MPVAPLQVVGNQVAAVEQWVVRGIHGGEEAPLVVLYIGVDGVDRNTFLCIQVQHRQGFVQWRVVHGGAGKAQPVVTKADALGAVFQFRHLRKPASVQWTQLAASRDGHKAHAFTGAQVFVRARGVEHLVGDGA